MEKKKKKRRRRRRRKKNLRPESGRLMQLSQHIIPSFGHHASFPLQLTKDGAAFVTHAMASPNPSLVMYPGHEYFLTTSQSMSSASADVCERSRLNKNIQPLYHQKTIGNLSGQLAAGLILAKAKQEHRFPARVALVRGLALGYS